MIHHNLLMNFFFSKNFWPQIIEIVKNECIKIRDERERTIVVLSRPEQERDEEFSLKD